MDCMMQDFGAFRSIHSSMRGRVQPCSSQSAQQHRPDGRLRSTCRRSIRLGCRCQATPDGGGSGKSAFNLRAWGAGLVNNLRMGFLDQRQQQQQQKQGVPPPAPPVQEEAAEAEEQQQQQRGREDLRAQQPGELIVMPASSAAAADDENSWERWKEYFMDMDAAYEQACECESALESAVGAEAYQSAAASMEEYRELQAQDPVFGVLKDLDAALKAEDYGAAAELRDAGCAGLMGWWVSRAEGDPGGHLLRVAPSYARYTCQMYTPRDFADLKGWNADGGYSPFSSMSALPWQPGAMFAAPDGEAVPSEDDSSASSSGAEEDVEPILAELGVPVLEVFLRRDAEGRLIRQAAVLKQDADGGAQGAAGALIGAFAEGGSPALDIHVDHSGSGADVLAMRITLGPDGAPQVESGTPDDLGLSGVSMTGPFASAEEALAAARAAGLNLQQDPEGGGMYVHAESEDGEQQGGVQQFERGPAMITRMDNNNFVVSVPAPPPAEPEEAADEPLGLFDGVPTPPDMDPAAAQAEVFRQLREALALTGDGPNGNPNPLGGLVVHEAFTSMPTPEEAADEAPSSSDSDENPSEGKSGDDAWRRAASEITRLHNARHPGAPLAISGDELAEQIRAAASGALDVLQRASAPPAICLQGTTLYSRIQVDPCSVDPFSGLYLGTFGPHGPEILQLQRSRSEDGEECVLGVKLTGDANVPAGAVSFRAKIGRRHRKGGYDMTYPPELEVSARYAGEGRVAHKGFKDARWVEGELLEFGGPNPLTRGAQLGFVWVVPGERRYLILLSRIELDDPRRSPC